MFKLKCIDLVSTPPSAPPYNETVKLLSNCILIRKLDYEVYVRILSVHVGC